MDERQTWVPEEWWQDLEEAEEVIEAAYRDAAAETGRDREAVVRLIERRMGPDTPLAGAFATILSHEHMLSYALRKGLEPVPGKPGKLRAREGGPLPIAEQRRLAGVLGVPLELLEDDDDDGED